WLTGNVERCVQQHGNASPATVSLEQRVEARRHLSIQYLHARRAINVRDGPEPGAPFRLDGKYSGHITCEPRATRRPFAKAIRHRDRHDRREGAEFFAAFDVAVETIARVG